MNVQKTILWICLFIIAATTVAAADGCITGNNCTWWLYTTSGTGYYDSDHANITIYHPNGTVQSANTSMSKVSEGIFRYDSIPNTTGNYMGCMEAYNTTSRIGIVCESKESREDIMSSTAFAGLTGIIALSIFIFSLLYFAFKLEKENGLLQILLLFIVNAMFVLIGWITISIGVVGATIFYNSTLFLFLIFSIYVFLKLGHKGLLFLKEVVPR